MFGSRINKECNNISKQSSEKWLASCFTTALSLNHLFECRNSNVRIKNAYLLNKHDEMQLQSSTPICDEDFQNPNSFIAFLEPKAVWGTAIFKVSKFSMKKGYSCILSKFQSEESWVSKGCRLSTILDYRF